MNGKFIVLEGLDGAGLSTQVALLGEHLNSNGIHFLVTKEPTNSLIGGISKAALSQEWRTSPDALQLLFCADRAHHLSSEIEPYLAKGKVVVCDRYLFSTLAYGYASGVNYKWLRSINLKFRLQDLGILIDVKPKTAISRLGEEPSNLHLFERQETVSRVRQAFLSIAKEFHLKKVDGEKSIMQVSERINSLVDKFLHV